MAFDTERSKVLTEARLGSRALAAQASAALAVVRPVAVEAFRRIRQGYRAIPIVGYFSGSLARRIILSNFIGLLILLLGYLYMNQYKDWLVDAKVDSLTAQGEIIAQAIAANATLDGERMLIDPEALPEKDMKLQPFTDDGFAALSFSIGPEKVAPILSRLVQPDVRARVYDREGRLIVDSGHFLAKGRVGEPRVGGAASDKPRTKNLWTRLTEYFFTSDLPVLKELDQANGNYYPPVRSAMAGTGTPMLLLNEEGQQIVSYAAPIRRAKQINGVLMLSTEPGEIEKVLSKERNAIARLALLAIAATLAASLLLAYSVAGPIQRLSEAAEAVSHNINARHTLPEFPDRKDEVARLATAFQDMTASLYRRIAASEKFAADVAHELKNPLTAARSTAESLTYAKTPEQRDQLVQQIQGELKRLNRLITDVSNASRLDAELALQEREPLDLTLILAGTVDTFRDLLSSTEKTIVYEPGPGADQGLIVSGHEGRLGQVITNLVDNALSFSPPHGKVTVRARRDGAMVEFAVEDEGPGIDADKLETVFDRFYTYRPTANSSRGNNSGLGLSITREIVRSHDGRIWAENRLASGADPLRGRLGARFIVRLPASPGSGTGVPIQAGRSAAHLTGRG